MEEAGHGNMDKQELKEKKGIGDVDGSKNSEGGGQGRIGIGR